MQVCVYGCGCQCACVCECVRVRAGSGWSRRSDAQCSCEVVHSHVGHLWDLPAWGQKYVKHQGLGRHCRPSTRV